jgi:hypothetical protein
MMMEKLVERLAGETEVLRENLPSAALSNTNPTCCPDANLGRRGGKPATNPLSYGTAFLLILLLDCGMGGLNDAASASDATILWNKTVTISISVTCSYNKRPSGT